jgi:hypothetical protein
VIPALAGVAVGTILTFSSNWLSERLRWKRDHGARWDGRRLDAYLAYADAVKYQVRVCRRLAAAKYRDVVTEPMDEAEAKSGFALGEDKRVVVFEAVLMLGTAETIKAARQWNTAVWDMYYHLQSAESTVEKFNSDFLGTGRAREAFLKAARKDLSVGDVLDPQPVWSWAEDLRRRGS